MRKSVLKEKKFIFISLKIGLHILGLFMKL